MDTSFWDNDEDRVQIVYQDDQLPPVQAPPVPTVASGMNCFISGFAFIKSFAVSPLFLAGTRFDLRDRFAEAQLKGVCCLCSMARLQVCHPFAACLYPTSKSSKVRARHMS